MVLRDLKHTPEDNKLQEKLSDLGEMEILNRLKRFMDEGQIDDDTSLLKISKKNLLINSDVLVENVHFNETTSCPEDIGWKAVTTNFSDLASSGVAEIHGITISLVAPPLTEWKWVESVYKGMSKALNKFGGKILGGDCSQGKERILAITAIGSIGTLKLHRGNARPGDWLVTTGPHGLSRLGLALLISEPIKNLELIPNALKLKAISHHRRPNPQIDALRKLIECKPPVAPWRAAGIDSSDGLIEAIKGICRSSKCKAIIYKEKIPKHTDWPEGENWDNWCLYGGEDYELVLSLPEVWANEWLKINPSGYKIGAIESGDCSIEWDNGHEIINTNHSQFKHF